ncbi:winged helix-turn-helix transcriptional regulator [Mangrovibacterium diazotrophicum]|uniref:HxlR family transcriptional regulator n=1 Tax=Mangrovibacterium diazotrophicum TaxID=1261403 RepID=A0A419VV97_9BACT|nr:helix-turn-helix domain-containing protein [Mangrovibacterium diazotrophicum]RKD85986.1 HxlR family transcriptional regulator [Mangrovibacterium diazotrophicum]
MKNYNNVENCPVRNVIDRIGDKWSMLVLLVLEEGEVMRFSEIHKTIETISQKMLTVTLKALEADGLVSRTVYPQIPPKVEYQLTERGKSLLPHLHSLVGWAVDNMVNIKQSRKEYAAELS